MNDADRQDAIHRNVRAQFAATAQRYVESESHAQGGDLARLLELSGPMGGKRVLDVATGGGHTALAFARAGAEVTAADLTVEMLKAAQRFLEGQGVAVRFAEARAEALPFAGERFDIVACRIAAHHFADPAAFVREAARVLKPGGRLMLVDNIAPLEPALARAMNAVEKERDPSHVEAYSAAAWVALCAAAGLDVTALERFYRVKPYLEWMSRAGASDGATRRLERRVLGLDAAARGYLRVEEQGGRLVSLAHEVMLLAALKR